MSPIFRDGSIAGVKTHLKISKKNLHIGTQEKRFSLAPFFGSSCLLGNRVRLKSGSIFCFQSICTMANQLLLCLSILHLLPHQLDSTRFENSSALDHVVVEGFQYGSDIQDDESSINLSVIMTNMASEEATAPESMFTHLDLYLSSLLNHYNKKRNSSLRLIIISDVTLVDHLRLHLKM